MSDKPLDCRGVTGNLGHCDFREYEKDKPHKVTADKSAMPYEIWANKIQEGELSYAEASLCDYVGGEKYINEEQDRARIIEAVRGMMLEDVSIGGATQRTYGQNEGRNQALQDIIKLLEGGDE